MQPHIQIAADICREFEGLELKAYVCPAGKWTIGWGSTFYEDGSPVRQGHTITKERAEVLLMNTLNQFDAQITPIITSNVNPKQRGALLDFAFNLGADIDTDTVAEGLGDSTLLKKVNANPNDPAIRTEFMKWNKARNKKTGLVEVMPGLTRRRTKEADIYFS